MQEKSKIFVAGHKGMVGSSLVRRLQYHGYMNIKGVNKSTLDLTNQKETREYFEEEQFDYVFLAAAKVGGIIANSTYPAEFIYNNLQIQNNIIHSSYLTNVKKLLFLGSSCIYPKMAPQPMQEKDLLSGYLEPSNEAYALAKIAGLKMCQFYNKQYQSKFISCMPCNLYGVNDNFHPENSHVIPGLIRRFLEARKNDLESVSCWGTGSPMREFLFVDDLADACILLMNKYEDYSETINIGSGEEISIKELVELVASIIRYEGKIEWDTSKPDGHPRKVMDVSKIKNLGWSPKFNLKNGITTSVAWYLMNQL
jgi:GDP-L-fucose synthase